MQQEPFVYHIIPAADWETAQKEGIYGPVSIETEGFIHCSNLPQVLGSANLFFKGQANLLLLKIEVTKLREKLVYENTTGGTELFPHLYGKLNLEAVDHVYTLDTNKEEQFVLPEELTN
ncbi:MAG TPA: DUF952 domain-containing protein [Microscillaceae bacterium]|nr:DUF952 domain-containing protein [Microscillaceae bacterium]